MRAKSLKVVVTFRTTTDAMAMERCCQDQAIPGRLIPLPTVLSADCGLCWAAPADAEDAVRSALDRAGLRYAGVHLLLL